MRNLLLIAILVAFAVTGVSAIDIANWKVSTVHGTNQYAISSDGKQLEYFEQPRNANFWYWLQNNGSPYYTLATSGFGPNGWRDGSRTFAATDTVVGRDLNELKLQFTYRSDPGYGYVTMNFFITDGRGKYGIFAPTSGGIGSFAQYTVDGDWTTITLDLTRTDIPDSATVALYEHNGFVNYYNEPYTTVTWGDIKNYTIAGMYDYQRSPANGWQAWGSMFNQINPSWSSFVIRNSAGGNSPQIKNVVTTEGQRAVEFLITESGMKAGWGTNSLNGKKLSDIDGLSILRLDEYDRFPSGSGPARGPYLNFWITDGQGHFAVVANEPSNPEWITPEGSQWNMDWDILKTKVVKAYENSDMSWLPNNGVGLTFDDLADCYILAPTPAQLSAGWTGLGNGAPRELGTNKAYGVNWVFGDTLTNYVTGDPGYLLANPSLTKNAPDLVNGYGIALIWGDTVANTTYATQRRIIKDVVITAGNDVYTGEFENAQIDSNILSLVPTTSSIYVKPGEEVEVLLKQSHLSRQVLGYQAFLSFDTSALTFSSNSAYVNTVYNMDFGPINADNSSINCKGGTLTATSLDADLARLKFTANNYDGSTTVWFTQNDPPSIFTYYDHAIGSEMCIAPHLVSSATIYIDDTPPVITLPADSAVTVATQTIEATATDNLSDIAGFTMNGVAFDGSEDVVLVPGANEFEFVATDNAGNVTTETLTITYTQPAPVINVYASLAPNKYTGQSSWSAWQANAVEAAKNESLVNGSGYAEFKDLGWIQQDFASSMVTGFSSWLGQLTTDNEGGTAVNYVYRIDNGVKTNPGAAKLDLNKVSVTHDYVYKGVDSAEGDKVLSFPYTLSGEFLAGNQKLKGYNWNGAAWEEVTSGYEADLIIYVWDRIGQDPQIGTENQEKLNKLYKALSGSIVNPDTSGHRTRFDSGKYSVSYTGHASVTDVNSGFKNITFAPLNDITKPVIIVTAPVDGLITNNNQLTITGTATDNENLASGIREVKITLNGAEVYANPTEDNVSFSKDVTLAEGNNTIVVTAKDFKGNEETVTRTVVLDTGLPTVTIDSAIQNGTDLLTTATKAIQGDVVITVSASDLGISGLVAPPAVKVTDASGNESILTASGSGPWTYTYTVTAATPNGVATITASISDNAGNASVDTKTFTVNKTKAVVTLTLERVDAPTVDRWIKFTIGGTGEGTVAPVTLVKKVTFTNGTATVTFEDPDLAANVVWTRISAKDEQHTLQQTVDLAGGTNGQYTATLLLLGGDLTNDNLVDIRDYGVFAGQFGTSPDMTTVWPTRNANISCAGIPGVDTDDFTYIQINFLKFGNAAPAGAKTLSGKTLGGANLPMSSITVEELAQTIGMREAKKADINKDGIVDLVDMKLFIEQQNNSKTKPVWSGRPGIGNVINPPVVNPNKGKGTTINNGPTLNSGWSGRPDIGLK